MCSRTRFCQHIFKVVGYTCTYEWTHAVVSCLAQFVDFRILLPQGDQNFAWHPGWLDENQILNLSQYDIVKSFEHCLTKFIKADLKI